MKYSVVKVSRDPNNPLTLISVEGEQVDNAGDAIRYKLEHETQMTTIIITPIKEE